MTIEDITYYIEKDMEEGFYGADCDLREMAHIEVLKLLKELQTHREAWEKVELRLKKLSIVSSDLDYYEHHGENWFDGIKDAIKIVDKYRPKDGDAE